MALKIIIVDDHEVVRLGLRTLLDRHPDFSVIDEAATVREAVQKTMLLRPDVVVMDIRLLGGSGIDACRKIVEQAPEIKVIMLTSYAEDEMLFDAIAAGACGYVLKQIGSESLLACARQRAGSTRKRSPLSLTRSCECWLKWPRERRIVRLPKSFSWARVRCATMSAAS
jgi:DNA-binding NarL/FixJ family response regulator